MVRWSQQAPRPLPVPSPFFFLAPWVVKTRLHNVNYLLPPPPYLMGLGGASGEGGRLRIVGLQDEEKGREGLGCLEYKDSWTAAGAMWVGLLD